MKENIEYTLSLFDRIEDLGNPKSSDKQNDSKIIKHSMKYLEILNLIEVSYEGKKNIDYILSFQYTYVKTSFLEETKDKPKAFVMRFEFNSRNKEFYSKKINVLKYIALAYMQNKDFKEAKNIFEKLIKIIKQNEDDPSITKFKIENVKIYEVEFNLGQCHYKLKEYKKAQQLFEKVLKNEPNNTTYRTDLAETYYKKSKAIAENYKHCAFILMVLVVISAPFFYNFYWSLINIKLASYLVWVGIWGGFSTFVVQKLMRRFKPVCDFVLDIKKGLKDFFFQSRYEFYKEFIKEFKYQEGSALDILNVCKMYYFNEQYDDAIAYAKKALIKVREKFPTEEDTREEYSVYIYDWLSRIAYKTKNHTTAIYFYEKVVEYLVKNPENIELGDEIHSKPELSEMINHLQGNRDILNKRENSRIVVPLVLSLIFATVLDGFQIYSSLGKIETQNTFYIFQKSKYCFLKGASWGIIPKEDLTQIILTKVKQKEKKKLGDIIAEHTKQEPQVKSSKKPDFPKGNKSLVFIPKAPQKSFTGNEHKVSNNKP